MTTKEEQKNLTSLANNVKKYFKIELTISIFDKVIFHWVYPPQNE